MIPATPDIWKIRPEAKLKYDEKFYQLKPVNGYITGEQAKSLFLMSGLPPQILAHIWALADRDADGKMDCNEFSIAMHLIELKMKGFDIPKSLPPSMGMPTATIIPGMQAFRPPVALAGAAVPIVPPAPMTNMAAGFVRPASPPIDKPQRTHSVSSQDSPTGMPPAPLIEWAVPQQAKLKFTQLFNSYDRTRTGFLTGAQAKNILVSTGLSQPVLAQIWSLSDIDGDGRLSCEEFVLAMHLAESVKAGDALPGVLPPDLIPPSHRRKRSTSIQSSGSGSSHALGDINLLGDFKDDKFLQQQTTFEDKRRENFEKGQAELEKRRLALLEAQRKEQEERERKEREEQERKDRIRQEQERRRQLELEKQLAKQRELEQEKEEQRRKALEQREAARREMERQRQLEWEKQRRQELISQRQKEQEAVCHLKNLNKNLTFELEQLSNKINELNEKISDTRKRVTDVKSSIDDMRTERDTKLSDMNNVKAKIKEMNDRLLILSQEKISMNAQLSSVTQSNPTSDSYNSVMHSFNNKQLALNQLRSTLSNIESETSQKQKDIENNNNQIEELKEKLKDIAENYKNLYSNYEERKTVFLEEKKARETNGVAETAVAFDDSWAKTDTNVADTWNDNAAPVVSVPNMVKYRILYAFDARNPDELSVMPGDIVLVPDGQSPEPGWLGGELHGKKGWFPEAYAERVEASQDAFANDNAFSNSAAAIGAPTETVHIVRTEMKRTLEGISEAPENGSETAEVSNVVRDVLQHSENSSFTQPLKTNPPVSSVETVSPVPEQAQSTEGLQAQALFPWKAKKENHLTFNKGDIINVKEQQDMWWFGEFQDKHGWFPKSYVKLISGPMKVNDNFQDNAFDRNELQEPPEVNTSPPEGIPEYYIATYAYQSQEPGDLCFQVGETILVTKKEGDWWTGTIGNRTGIFPSNYVKKVEGQPTIGAAGSIEAKNESDLSFQSMSIDGKYRGEIVTVLAPYKATGREQLSLEKGQLIRVRKKTAGGWWEGEIQVKGKKRQVGWFPASYVKELSGSRASSNRSTPEPMLYSRFNENLNGGPQQSDQVVALYPFAGQHSDELTFQKGDIITLVNTDDPSWWKGELNGAVGLFPSNYVEVLLKQNPSTQDN